MRSNSAAAVRQARTSPRNEIEVIGGIFNCRTFTSFIQPCSSSHCTHIARYDRHAHTHLHEALDAFNRRHLDGMLERRAVSRQNSSITRRRKGDSTMCAMKFSPPSSATSTITLSSSPGVCLGGYNQRQLILQYFRCQQLRVARHKGNRAEVQTVVQNFVWNIAGKHAVHAHLYAGVLFRNLASAGRSAGWNSHSHREKVRPVFKPSNSLSPFLTSSRR